MGEKKKKLLKKSFSWGRVIVAESARRGAEQATGQRHHFKEGDLMRKKKKKIVIPLGLLLRGKSNAGVTSEKGELSGSGRKPGSRGMGGFWTTGSESFRVGKGNARKKSTPVIQSTRKNARTV